MHNVTSRRYCVSVTSCFVANEMNGTRSKEVTEMMANECPRISVHYEIAHKNNQTATVHTIGYQIPTGRPLLPTQP